MSDTRHEQRAQRILDAAAGLVLRWGYKRVTIEEVAKHAGIGKGTVYLHFQTRAWLFMCVLMRESLELVDELVAAIRRDPAALLPSEQARLTYLGVVRRPLLQAMFGRDVDLLGDLAHEAAVEPLRALKIDLAGELFALLREHGLMRTDLDIDIQRYVLSAVQTGFYLSEPVTAVTAPPESAAAALSHTICHAVQPPGSPDPDALAALAPKVIAMYEQFRGRLAASSRGKAPEGSEPALGPHDLPAPSQRRAATPSAAATRTGPGQDPTSTRDQTGRSPASPHLPAVRARSWR
jgi:AcrR family transcriptional regulator